jgi:putative oxidoreductase
MESSSVPSRKDFHVTDAAYAAAGVTSGDVGMLALRVVTGIIFMFHGGQKLFGLFEGPGLAAVVENMGNLGYLVAIGEFFGGLALLAGLLSRFSAFWLIVIMLGAIIKVHGKNGFSLAEQGYEYNLALIGMCLPVLIAGPGRIAFAWLLPFLRSRTTGRPRAWVE